MVKNTTGGKKAKGSARKFSNANAITKNVLVKSSNEYEMYAVVVKLLGGNRCEVLCQDNIKRNCVIRGIFRGRNKKSNNVIINSLVLVGLRDFEKKITEEISDIKNCDLLEVYTDEEKDRIKSIELSVDWNILSPEESLYSSHKQSSKEKSSIDQSDFYFVNDNYLIEENELFDNEDSYSKLFKSNSSTTTSKENHDLINIDDI